MSDATRPANLICWNERSRADRALVCIPWAGAGAAPFRRWVPVLGNATRIYGVRFAGRHPVAVVEMGWPSRWRPARAKAFVTTHGASLANGRAAAEALGIARS